MLLSLIVVNTAQSNDPIVHLKCMDIPGGTSGKELTCQCKKKKERVCSLGWEDSPGGGHDNLL